VHNYVPILKYEWLDFVYLMPNREHSNGIIF